MTSSSCSPPSKPVRPNMIDFAFTAEQEDFRKELRRFAVTELAPRYLERAVRGEFCWPAHRQLAELGVLGLGLPEKFGGTGEPDPITLGLATEALAGQPHTDLATMCKWWPPQVAKEVIETAWVTHGNLGYSAESPLQQRYRDVASYLVADGTAAIQKRIIATSLLGKVATQ